MKNVLEIGSWIILAALTVLVVMNASKFAQAVASPIGFVESETSMFTGSNYGNSNFGK